VDERGRAQLGEEVGAHFLAAGGRGCCGHVCF
jgi:hypothetical protein